MEKWKILSEEDISPSKWFPIHRHVVELPNGKIVDDYFLSPMIDVAMVLPITVNHEIVLVRQYRHAAGEIMLELPAGGRQEGKTLEESALAELEEETGIRTTLDNLIFLGKTSDSPTKLSSATYCYLAKNLEFNSRQNLEETEDIELVKVSPSKALDMVKSGEIWAADTVANISRAYFLYPEIFE